ncbi:hypothetical protein HKX48_006205 [Thoreauomyces humboldtii]|nr:hypothetical protein HKX48_006205 [Thoreauomyces humboldtii]
MSDREGRLSDVHERDREYLEALQDRDGGVSAVQTEGGKAVGLKAQVRSDMKRVI